MTALVAHVSGPRPRLDPRRHIIRADLVDIALSGTVAASRYVEPVAMRCVVPRTVMRDAPDGGAVSELLFGEGFDLFEAAHGWAFGRSNADHYTGWLPLAALGEPSDTTATVSARRAPVFAAADIKAPVLMELPFGAHLSGVMRERFWALGGGGFVHHRHIAPPPATPLAVARLFTGAPYVWGGRCPDGVDCSGLVQAALTACGIPCPRDSDMQRAELGAEVGFAERRGGDLVFFPGHVGILVDADTLFHANAHWMAVVEEPLADVIARQGADPQVSFIRL